MTPFLFNHMKLRLLSVVRNLSLPALLLVLGTATPATAASKSLELARQLNEAFVEVADTVSKSVVVIEVTFKPSAEGAEGERNPMLDRLPDWFRREFLPDAETPDESPNNAPRSQRRSRRQAPIIPGSGSGVVLREDGYILTNAHVVKDSITIKVKLKDGREFDAEVRGIDELSEVAVIKLKGEDIKGLPVVKFANSDKVRVGEFAIAIGAPFALDYSVTIGHVSAKGRANVVPGYLGGANMDQDFIQTDANINPGNSGGPLVNLEGEVMGINTLIRGIGTGIGFAIPSNLARKVADQLIKGGTFERAWLGIAISDLRDLPDWDSLAPGHDQGVVIMGIPKDTPAARSDLKPSDLVIAVNGKSVKSVPELRNEVRSHPLGTKLQIEVIRGGKELTIEVATGLMPDSALAGRSNLPRTQSPPPEIVPLGLKVEAITPSLAKQYGLKQKEGVVITAVTEDSPAADLGLAAGMVITDLNHKPVKSVDDFRTQMGKSNLKKGVLLNYVDAEGNSKFQVLKEE